MFSMIGNDEKRIEWKKGEVVSPFLHLQGGEVGYQIMNCNFLNIITDYNYICNK